MPGRIERIVIVGGGTAGWLSAAYLQTILSGASRRQIDITVVESDDVATVGVGEATIPSIVAMLRVIGVPEWRLMSEADATFKNAIKFVNWGGIPGPEEASSYFYHQFDPPPTLEGFSSLTHWLALKNAGVKVAPLWDSTSIGGALCDANRSPKLFNSAPYEAPIPYAYHIDAVKLGRLLRSIALERGVTRVVDHVETVDRDESGDIVALHTRDGRQVEGDLFLDCTGFHALLIEGAFNEPLKSYADLLLCDRAIACQVPRTEDSQPPRCYTTSTAQSAGWIWGIDLLTRTGTGYVYSSRFVDDDAAERALLDHIGPQPGVELSPRRISMRIGRRQNVWVNNCVAVGLSAGFLEPLESTGIHFIDLALTMLVEHLGEGDAMIPLRAQYNKLMGEVFDDAAEFIAMHYIFNGRRSEPFWDHYRNNVVLPQSLVEKLEVWAYKIPSNFDLHSRVTVFGGFSYFAIMAGLNTLPPFGGSLSPFLDLKKSAAVLDQISEQRARAIQVSPLHEDVLKKLRAVAG